MLSDKGIDLASGALDSDEYSKDSTDPLNKKEMKDFQVQKQPAKIGNAVMGETFRLNRALFPLKIALFLHAGGVTTMQTFLPIYLTHLNLSIAQISIIQSIAPIFQFLGVTITGIISEKTGRAKDILYVNIILALVFLNMFMIVPSLNSKIEIQNQCLLSHNIFEGNRTLNVFPNCSFHCEINSRSSSDDTHCFYNKSAICTKQESVHQHRFLCKDITSTERTKNVLSNTTAALQFCGSLCKPPDLSMKSEDTTVFALALMLTVGFKTAYFIVYCFLDVTSINMAQLHASDYGRQRFWLIIGTIVVPPIAGYLIEATTPAGVSDNYYAAFYIFDIFYIAALLSVWKLEEKTKPRSEKLGKKFIHLMKSPEFLAFFIVVFILSVLWGFKYDFTSLYLEELGASSLLMSLVPTVIGISALPFLFVSNWWLDKIGSVNLLLCSFCAYTFGYTTYSYLGNPWWCLLCELMTIFTAHLNWVAVVRCNNEITPEGARTAVITTLASIHYGLGIAAGSVIGGFFMSEFGGRKAFRLMAIIAFSAGISYACFIAVRRRMKRGPKTVELSLDERCQDNPKS